MDIIKSNTLIAEFMGGEYKSKYRECSDCGKPTNELLEKVEFNVSDYCPLDYHWCTPNELKYHSDWDWLMPVVEKVGSTDWSCIDIHYGTGATDSFAWCTIKWSNHNYKNKFKTSNLLNEDEQSSLIATYKAVIEFIHWWCKENRIACEGYPASEAKYGSIAEYYKDINK
jgi:hypothetical protein